LPSFTPIAAAAVQRRNETLLLVEDEDNLRNMARLSGKEGYTVLEAPDRAAAIQLASAHPGPIHLL
jgi:CheY-like chemotaxis protein